MNFTRGMSVSVSKGLNILSGHIKQSLQADMLIADSIMDKTGSIM